VAGKIWHHTGHAGQVRYWSLTSLYITQIISDKLAMHHRLQWFIHVRADGLDAYALLWSMAQLPF